MSSEDPPSAFLVEAAKREPLLAALRAGPRELNDLTGELDMSRSTLYRATQTFVERDVVRKTDSGIELTGFGRTVADRAVAFRTKVEAAERLRPFLNVVDATEVDIPVVAFEDADVVSPKPRQPHFAVKRIIELIEDAETVRLFSSIISPFYVDVAYREMLDGTEIEAVFDPEVVDIVASEYPEKASGAAETGRFDLFVEDEVPFELFVFDESIGMAAHDDGIARVFVEADSPGAVEWAENLYERFRQRADRIDVTAF